MLFVANEEDEKFRGEGEEGVFEALCRLPVTLAKYTSRAEV